MNKRRIVLTGGVYDLMHTGHTYYLAAAKSQGQGTYLIVNVVPDDRVKEKKGDDRPIMPLQERMDLVASVQWVDEVTSVLAEPGQTMAEYVIKYLQELSPDVFVISIDDPEIKTFCQEKGIEFIYLPSIKPRSGMDTSALIDKIRS